MQANVKAHSPILTTLSRDKLELGRYEEEVMIAAESKEHKNFPGGRSKTLFFFSVKGQCPYILASWID